jgi:hypothetical protein
MLAPGFAARWGLRSNGDRALAESVSPPPPRCCVHATPVTRDLPPGCDLLALGREFLALQIMRTTTPNPTTGLQQFPNPAGDLHRSD